MAAIELNRHDYTVGVICALPKELAAMDIMLDVEHLSPGSLPGDTNNYSLGVIAGHNVVIACLPAGHTGTVSAATASAHLRSSYPRVSVLLMVGIAGGVPSKANDVRLGDVVVSQPSGTSGGVVQYDFGKTLQGGTFQRTGQLPPPSSRVLSAVASLKAEHMKHGQNLSAVMKAAAQKYPNMSRYCRHPGAALDQLFQAEYDHCSLDDSPSHLNVQCSACDKNFLVHRSARTTSEPSVHYGTIASGNQVMKDGLTRDKIAAENDLLCFEMEAAGLMQDRCLVIRGVCDYADSHKSKDWQEYAAVVAAAYAKDLLKVLPVQSLRHTPEIRIQNGGQSLISRDPWQVQLSDENSTWTALINGISDYDREKSHRRLSLKRLNGTGEWLLVHPKVIDWSQGTFNNSLWCSGGVGAGKTMLCTKLVDYMKSMSTSTGKMLIYFYCETSNPKTTHAKYVFRSLIQQILHYLWRSKRRCPKHIMDDIESLFRPSGLEPDLDDLTSVFSNLFPLVSEAIYLIDGLDELGSTDVVETLSTLHRLFKDASTQKLFLASRDELGVNLRPALSQHLHILPTATEEDINHYVDCEVSRKTIEERAITDSQELMNKIKHDLQKGACGMFLWVRLQIEALWLDCFCDEDINAALADLPPDLPSTFNRCVNRIPTATRAMAAKALRWISVSETPLHIDELREAVSFDLNDRSWNPAKIIQARIITGSCSNLVVRDDYDCSIRLTHPSVRSYLVEQQSGVPSDLHIDEVDATLQCGEQCVNYLNFTDFSLQLQVPEHSKSVSGLPSPAATVARLPFAKSLRAIPGLFPHKPNVHLSKVRAIKAHSGPQRPAEASKFAFLSYASSHWAYHTKKISSCSSVWTLFESLALQPVSSWQVHPWISSGQSLSSHYHAMLSWASREDHLPMLNILLDRGEQYSIRNFCDLPCAEDGLPALHTASRLGSTEAVKLLTKYCNVNATGPGSRTALHYAVEKGHLGVVEWLLSTKELDLSIEPAEASEKLSPALLPTVCLALFHNHREIAKQLLYAGAKPWGHSNSNEALGLAARSDDIETFVLLLEKGRNYGDCHFESALEAVAENGNKEIASLILQQPQVNKKFLSPCLGRLFCLTIQYRHLEVAKVLCGKISGLKAARVTISRRECLNDAIQMAVITEEVAFLDLFVSERLKDRLFLFFGTLTEANMERREQSNWLDTRIDDKLLLRAAAKGNDKIVATLLQLDPDPLYQDEHGAFSLLVAILHNHEVTAKVLWAHNSLFQFSDLRHKKLAMLIASTGQRLELWVQSLPPRVPYSMYDFEKLLLDSAECGHDVIVKLLLERTEVNVNCQTSFQQTALVLATRKQSASHADVIRLLLNHPKILTDVRDATGRTALMTAVQIGNVMALSELLLKCDTKDIYAPDHTGRTLLYYATECRHGSAIVEVVLKNCKVAADAKDTDGNTLLMIAAAEGNLELVEYLSRRKDVNVNSKNLAGHTPLALAVLNAYHVGGSNKLFSVIHFLLQHQDVDINTRANRDRAVLSLAAEVGDVSIVDEVFRNHHLIFGASETSDRIPS